MLQLTPMRRDELMLMRWQNIEMRPEEAQILYVALHTPRIQFSSGQNEAVSRSRHRRAAL